jgi:alpha-mannosidase
MANSIIILGSYESIYFGMTPESGELGQWVFVTIKSQRATIAHAAVEADGMAMSTRLALLPGIRAYKAFAPVLWPRSYGCTGTISLEAEGELASSPIEVGHHRPWKIYVLSDLCMDYTWAYGTDAACHADDMAVVEAEMRCIEATSSQPAHEQNRYNFVVSREVELYAANHDPGDVEKLFARIRDGHLSVSPFPTMSLTASQGFEELVRQFSPVRAWELEHGMSAQYANHQETPSMTWTLASVLAGSGIPYLVSGLLPFETPWNKRLAEPPLYWWEGPDGSRVLVRRYNHDYMEAGFVLRDHATIRQAIERRVVPEYEKLGDAFPFDAVGLVGCYGDLSFETRGFPQRKCTGISEYNAQGWEYPRLINASHELFWQDVQSQVDAGRSVPTFRGDYGAGWEIWLATLAAPFAQWRRAQERGPAADRFSLAASRLEPRRRAEQKEPMDRAWKALIALSDHAWNGSDGANRSLNLGLRRRWAQEANAGFDACIGSALEAIARRISSPSGDAVAVFNALGWSRTAMARWEVPDERPRAVRDMGTGAAVSVQLQAEGGRRYLCFEAADVPAVGYRTYAISADCSTPPPEPDAERTAAVPVRAVIENRQYALEVDPATGGIRSLLSKALGREMADQDSPWRLNQWLYRVQGRDVPVTSARISGVTRGPVFSEIAVETSGPGITVSSFIRLYAHADRIDIRNVVEKVPTEERESLHFAFPVDIPGRVFRFEAPGAVITAGETGRGGEQLPGSGQAYTAVRHFADASNGSFGVTLSQADSGFVQFGRRTEEEDPVEPDPSSSTMLALALGNSVNFGEVTRDQGGDAAFVFSFSLRVHGPFEPDECVRFAWEDNNGLEARPVHAGSAAVLPGGAHGFIEVQGEGIVLLNMKGAEDLPEGIVVRLWNTREREREAMVALPGLGAIRGAQLTDLLERPLGELPVANGGVRVKVPPRGYATVLFTMAAA